MGRNFNIDWKKIYRLSFLDNQTHKKVHSWTFSMRQLVIVSATAVVAILFGIYALIAYTPIRTTIPGYPDGRIKAEMIENAMRIDSLENAIARWNLYAENLSRVLAGEQSLNPDSIKSDRKDAYLRNLSESELARRDSIMRAMVAKEEQFGISEKSERQLPIEGLHFFCPLKGAVSQGFDKALHPGIDITAPTGSVISSVLDGTVIYSGWSDENGYTIHIQHPGDLVSSYKHNRKLLREVGEKVKAGTPVALLGSTGSLSTGDHLHFELWYKGEAVNPAKYIIF